MEIGFKDSNEQKKCSYEIRSVFVKSFEDIKKLFTEKRLLLGRFALNDDEVEKLLNLIKSKVSFEIDFIGKEDTYIVLDLDRGWCSISYVDLLYNGKVYKFEADRYRTSVGIRKYITTSEKIEKRIENNFNNFLKYDIDEVCGRDDVEYLKEYKNILALSRKYRSID